MGLPEYNTGYRNAYVLIDEERTKVSFESRFFSYTILVTVISLLIANYAFMSGYNLLPGLASVILNATACTLLMNDSISDTQSKASIFCAMCGMLTLIMTTTMIV